MSGFCCGVEQSPLCPSIAVSLLFQYRDLQCCAKREEFSDTWSSFEGRLSRDARPVGPNRTFASVSSARFSLGGKLRLFTFKCRLAEWFKRTRACALDLAALENIPSLSFRIVYQAGVVQLCGVLNPPPLLEMNAGGLPSSYLMGCEWLLRSSSISTKAGLCYTLIHIQWVLRSTQKVYLPMY